MRIRKSRARPRPLWDFGGSNEPMRSWLEDIKIKAGWMMMLRDETEAKKRRTNEVRSIEVDG